MPWVTLRDIILGGSENLYLIQVSQSNKVLRYQGIVLGMLRRAARICKLSEFLCARSKASRLRVILTKPWTIWHPCKVGAPIRAAAKGLPFTAQRYGGAPPMASRLSGTKDEPFRASATCAPFGGKVIRGGEPRGRYPGRRSNTSSSIPGAVLRSPMWKRRMSEQPVPPSQT